MTEPDYDRDVRHYTYDIKDKDDFEYGVGECLAVYPHNVPSEVESFLKDIKLDPNTILHLERNDG